MIALKTQNAAQLAENQMVTKEFVPVSSRFANSAGVLIGYHDTLVVQGRALWRRGLTGSHAV
ncbi:hypothetical protein FDV58_39375 [Bradyrhizobium elkanii]|uniref:Uncharacterized protein n=1 Tax=Bradyrhizobium elkanii TaxID=29448 RepID=A0A4U6RCI9_BRAEL|nr:hypothetical protein [Bradyrhizobium elkanii]TKV71679.1 hypothetical protein FDV58_39375 [Bradyrhizobium elkanii]